MNLYSPVLLRSFGAVQTQVLFVPGVPPVGTQQNRTMLLRELK